MFNALILPLALVGSQPPLPAQYAEVPAFDSATVFATIGLGEWCPEGSVHIDLWTGDYSLMPRSPRADCGDPDTRRQLLRGSLTDPQLQAVRTAYRRVWIEGIETDEPELVVMNSGPRILVLTGSWGNLYGLDNLSDWSDAAFALHDQLESLFGQERALLSAEDLSGRRVVED